MHRIRDSPELSAHKGENIGTRTQPAFPLWGKER